MGVNTDADIPARIIRAPRPAGKPWEEVWLASLTKIDATNSLYSDASLIYVTSNRAGTNRQGGIFRSADGTSWSRINHAQFGDGTNIVHSLVNWRGALWVRTQNTSVGGAIRVAATKA